MSAELISPELALVCPDLRARAIVGLPSPRAEGRPRLHASSATAGRAEQTERIGVARVVAAYALARVSDLLAIMAGIGLFVLVLAAVGVVIRG